MLREEKWFILVVIFGRRKGMDGRVSWDCGILGLASCGKMCSTR